MLNIIKNLFGAGPDVKALVDDGAVIIDVRTAAEYKSGHVKKSINIPLDQIGHNIGKIREMNVPVVTCCKSGARSGMAASKLKSHGVEAYNGGGWTAVDRALS
jgi:rhodanese-related sulfurtransferase